MIKLEKITKTYDNRVKALKGIDLEIKKGEFVFLVGSSGAGKSTLIKLLLKEENPTSGIICLDGENITKVANRKIPHVRRKLGVVFQDFRLLPDKTVYENVAFAMEIVGKPSREIRRRVPAVLSLVGLGNKSSRFPDELSGGEHQRVAIARAIVNEPPVLIADEPTGNLDPETAWEIMDLLKDINRRGTTILMATHAKDIVDKMQLRVVALKDGEIIRDDKVGEYGDDI